MNAVTHEVEPIVARDRLLVVADQDRLLGLLRDRYPDCEVTRAETFLSAIHETTRHSPQAVIAYVDPSRAQLSAAVAGLREAASEHTRLILCCPPESEPLARQAMQNGADDYILFPVKPDELDRALGYSPEEPSAQEPDASVPQAGVAELNALAEALQNLEGEPADFLRRIAEVTRIGTGASGVSLVVEGSAVSAGKQPVEPVLAETVQADGRVIGQISLGARPNRPYTRQDVDKLRHLARLASTLLRTASRHRRWHTLALTDEASGLPNRRYLLRFLDDILDRAAAERFRVTLLIFDIDDFKTFNDACGHDAGDEILRLVGNLFRHHCRDHDVVTRYGGDEFAVVFWDAEERRVADSRHPENAMEVLARFTKELGAANHTALARVPRNRITISGGLATYPWDARSRDELIQKADQALIQAKQAGKNRIFTVAE